MSNDQHRTLAPITVDKVDDSNNNNQPLTAIKLNPDLKTLGLSKPPQ